MPVVSLIVQKFGGTSVADASKIRRAAERVMKARAQGHDVVVVVSARGKTTDDLIRDAAELSDDPPPREMDALLATGEQITAALLAMTLESEGQPAISFTGGQAGIATDASHSRARITTIEADRIREQTAAGRVVVVCGFQGVQSDGSITTLGRGGSDTTATALAAALAADECEIYTDVTGVFTTNPKHVATARRLEQISYDEMLELASLGAGVMHSRSVEFAKKYAVPLRVRSASEEGPGTLIGPESGEARPVIGLALVEEESRVSLDDIPDQPGVLAAIFDCMAERRIPIDMVVQNVGHDRRARVSFTVPKDELEDAIAAAEQAIAAIGSGRVSVKAKLAKVSAVGRGMVDQAGVAARMFRSLAAAGINVEMITTSEIKISALVTQPEAIAALRATHEEFRLDQTVEPTLAVRGQGDDPLGEAVGRLVEMEDIVVSEVRVDRSQALVTLNRLPDVPGVVATVLEAVAAAGIPVDMIVQNAGVDGRASLSLTIPRDRVGECIRSVSDLGEQFAEMGTSSEAAIAKLTVDGVGLRSHTGVGRRLFAAVAESGANVLMVATSEVSVSAVLSDDASDAAARVVRERFGFTGPTASAGTELRT